MVVGLLVVALLGSAACSSGDGGSDPDTATTVSTEPLFGEPRPTLPTRNISEGTAACGLLTRAEVEAALTVGVAPGTGIEREGTGSACSWALRSDATQKVGVSATPGDAAAFQAAVRQLGAGVERLTGVGEGAIVGEGVAYGIKSGTLVLVTINTRQTLDRRKSAARALVEAAVRRI